MILTKYGTNALTPIFQTHEGYPTLILSGFTEEMVRPRSKLDNLMWISQKFGHWRNWISYMQNNDDIVARRIMETQGLSFTKLIQSVVRKMGYHPMGHQ